jgi:hypothetical protein
VRKIAVSKIVDNTSADPTARRIRMPHFEGGIALPENQRGNGDVAIWPLDHFIGELIEIIPVHRARTEQPRILGLL